MIRFLNALTLILLAASILSQNPLLFLLAALLALVVLVTALWGRYALAGVTYTRKFGETRVFAGEETDLWIELVNAKPLPLAWLRANDEFPVEMQLDGGTLHPSANQARRILTILLSLHLYERVRKHYRLRPTRRGAFEFGPVQLSSGDMFGLRTQELEIPTTDLLIVYPRVVPLTALGLPAAHPFGDAKMTRRIVQDPVRLMGVRGYVAGDSPRLIHWKATARRGALQTKLLEPSASRVSIIFLDGQTVRDRYLSLIPEYLEFAFTAAASVARALLDAREAVGLYANTARRNVGTPIRLPPSRRPAQWTALLDALAWSNNLAVFPLPDVMRAEQSALPFGATLIAISAVVDDALVSALLDAKRAGHPVALLAIGAEPPRVPDALRVYWLGGHAEWHALTELNLV